MLLMTDAWAGARRVPLYVDVRRHGKAWVVRVALERHTGLAWGPTYLFKDERTAKRFASEARRKPWRLREDHPVTRPGAYLAPRDSFESASLTTGEFNEP